MDIVEYPKMLYLGKFDRNVGLGGLKSKVVSNSKEEKAALKEGWFGAEDIEANATDTEAKPAKKDEKKGDDAGGEE